MLERGPNWAEKRGSLPCLDNIGIFVLMKNRLQASKNEGSPGFG
jgi:hypothetical protein